MEVARASGRPTRGLRRRSAVGPKPDISSCLTHLALRWNHTTAPGTSRYGAAWYQSRPRPTSRSVVVVVLYRASWSPSAGARPSSGLEACSADGNHAYIRRSDASELVSSSREGPSPCPAATASVGARACRTANFSPRCRRRAGVPPFARVWVCRPPARLGVH
jgi:hypothetical protein